jgi:hypothetical protein
MLQAILGILAAPILGSLTDAYKAKLESGNNKTKVAGDLAIRDIELQQRERELQKEIRIAQTGKWWTVENLAGYCIVFYMGKVYIWDAALGLGVTDPVKGTTAEWGALVIAFFFGTKAITSTAKIIASIWK